MPIDLANETVVDLTEATKLLPKLHGRRPSISTLWRWCQVGVKGVRLDYIRVGRRIATSREALGRFCIALAEADEQRRAPARPIAPAAPRPSDAARRRSMAEADRILEEAGI